MSCYILSLISANDSSAKQNFYTRKFLSFQFLCRFIIVFNDYRHSFVRSFSNFSFIWSNIFWNVPQLINKYQHSKIKLQSNVCTLDFSSMYTWFSCEQFIVFGKCQWRRQKHVISMLINSQSPCCLCCCFFCISFFFWQWLRIFDYRSLALNFAIQTCRSTA